MRLSDSKIASFLQLLVIILIMFSLTDYFVTGLVNQYAHTTLTYGLYFNYYLFSAHGLSPAFNFINLPIWGIFQFFIYCLVVILTLQLWKTFRSEHDSKIKTLKFTTIFSFFIVILSLLGALMLSYTGLAANGLYTMNITYVRIVIVLLYSNVVLSLIIIAKVYATK